MHAKPLDTETPVGQWVRAYPATSRVFDRYGIDFCCGGKAALSTACGKAGVSVSEVEHQLKDVIGNPGSGGRANVDSLTLAELCDTIVADHHEFLRAELPRVGKMIDKVLHAHGERHTWLAPLKTAFDTLSHELLHHMAKEEQVLFPAIKKLEAAATRPAYPFGSIDNPIHAMEHEHNEAGLLLAEIRRLSSGFAVPSGACNTFRAMLDGLRELEDDMHHHVHRENNILFIKASERFHALASV